MYVPQFLIKSGYYIVPSPSTALVITIPRNQFMDLPNLSNPSNIMTIPDKKVRSTTNAGSLLACSAVMKATIAAGPTAMSLEVPKMTYIKQPIKDE